jgi:RNA polymerase sigma-70 factor, ECF subfamily
MIEPMDNKNQFSDIPDFRDYVIKLKKNDDRAWEHLNLVLKRVLVKWLNKKGVNKSNFKELYNNIMAVFIEKFQGLTFENFSSLKSYVFAIAENKVKEFYRAQTREHRTESLEQVHSKAYFEGLNAIEENEDQYRLKKIYALVDHLSFQEKKVLLLYYNEEKSLDEIAELLQLTPGNVRVIKHRAIEKIKVLLGKSKH